MKPTVQRTLFGAVAAGVVGAAAGPVWGGGAVPLPLNPLLLLAFFLVPPPPLRFRSGKRGD
ncbi:hypothetical protein [Nocardia abscessus]|uniref:hypothetical protein n=1 Tax=Nocardia abscessus TaxID=120957 RepID=UPI002455F591|nr:hypothetical protein [Nocardia abscessus]